MDRKVYQRLVRRLIYLARTRPNIGYSVRVISQFMHDPRKIHLQAAYRVLNYLKAHLGKGFLFKKTSDIALAIYIGADFAGPPLDMWSSKAIVHFLGEI